MLTPNSSSVPYVTQAQFLSRYDARTVAQLLSDSGSAVTDLPNDPVLNDALSDASAEFESAALIGGRYNPADLTALINSGTVGGNLIIRLVSDLTMGFLRARRAMPESEPYSSTFLEALRKLELLRKGEEILPFLETQEAGVAQTTDITQWQMREQGRLTAIFPRFFGPRYERWW